MTLVFAPCLKNRTLLRRPMSFVFRFRRQSGESRRASARPIDVENFSADDSNDPQFCGAQSARLTTAPGLTITLTLLLTLPSR